MMSNLRMYESASLHNGLLCRKLLCYNSPKPLSYFKQTYFDAPAGTDPVALDLASMGKGQAWVNGHHIGRYWTLVAPKDGCEACDYRGPYDSDKCATNCGKPTQTWYHVPRSWLQASHNLLVIFEEIGGNPFDISVKLRLARIICAQVSQSHYPRLSKYGDSDFIGQELLKNNMTPEINLYCQGGDVISSITFASYGNPQGSCQNFAGGSCHAPNSLSVVSKVNSATTEFFLLAIFVIKLSWTNYPTKTMKWK